MEALAQTSSGSAEARAVKARRDGEARAGRRRRPRRKVVARRVEEKVVVVAVAQVVVRRRTAMPRSSGLVSGLRRRRAVGGGLEAEAYLGGRDTCASFGFPRASPPPEASRRCFFFSFYTLKENVGGFPSNCLCYWVGHLEPIRPY